MTPSLWASDGLFDGRTAQPKRDTSMCTQLLPIRRVAFGLAQGSAWQYGSQQARHTLTTYCFLNASRIGAT